MTEVTSARLEMKLKQLRITVDRTYQVIESNRQDAIERHCTAIKSVTNSTNEMRVSVGESKIQAEVETTEITTWNAEIDKELVEANIPVEELSKWLEKYKRDKDNVAREEQIQLETNVFIAVTSPTRQETALKSPA